MGPIPEDAIPPLVLSVHGCLTNRARLVLIFWLVALAVGGLFAPYFINKAEDRLTAPFRSRVGKLLSCITFIFR